MNHTEHNPGLYISGHPLQPYKEILSKYDVYPIRQLKNFEGEKTVTVGGVISTVKKIITKKGQVMLFVKIEDATDNIEVIVFPSTLEKTQNLWKEENIILIRGKATSKDGKPKIICENAKNLNQTLSV